MNTLDIAISFGLTPKRVSTHKGGEYHSPCPMCGGTDRFHVWPDQEKNGSWWCRGCGKGGDAIQLLIEARGMSFKEACTAVGAQVPAFKRGRAPQPPRKPADDWQPRVITDPAELWRSKAGAFAGRAHELLLKTPAELKWLADRGITAETARRFRLGWNPQAAWHPKPSWGLEDDGKKLWLPRGLVIPWYTDGHIHRLRVRRPELAAEPRYLVVSGSGSAPTTIKSSSLPCRKGAWVIVESELDAILVAQDAGDIVGVAALGNSTAKPDGPLAEELKASALILNALDFEVKDAKDPGAGGKAWLWWQKHFTQAERWPVPAGKDPGDYRKTGGDVRAWILAGLPPGLRPAPPVVEPEKKQPVQADDLSKTVPAVPGKQPEGDLLAGYIADTVCCLKCRKPLETYMLKGMRYKGLCSNCLPKDPWEGVWERKR